MGTRRKLRWTLGVIATIAAAPAMATLTSFATFTGSVGYSSDGFGIVGTTPGTISASVPVGSTVLAAYLYTSYFFTQTPSNVNLNGNLVTVGPAMNNSNGFLGSARANVTSIVKPVVDGGPGGVYNFTISETSDSTSGEALIVVYSNPLIATSTFALLDGFAATGGDVTSVNFANPLDPTAPGFHAEMFLGINHSCCNQSSNVTVNGTLITQNAGNNDDGVGAADNSQLITVGGFDDPFSPLLPSYANDHERYNLVPEIALGDTTITVRTNNPTNDDNIFLAGFYVAGVASINSTPEPGTLALFGAALAGLAGLRRRK